MAHKSGTMLLVELVGFAFSNHLFWTQDNFVNMIKTKAYIFDSCWWWLSAEVFKPVAFNTGFLVFRNGFCIVDLDFRQRDGLDDFLTLIPDPFFHDPLPSCLPCSSRNAFLVLPLTWRRDAFQEVLIWYAVTYHSKKRARGICNRNNNDHNYCIFIDTIDSYISFKSLESKTGILNFE